MNRTRADAMLFVLAVMFVLYLAAVVYTLSWTGV